MLMESSMMNIRFARADPEACVASGRLAISAACACSWNDRPISTP
jgi:hypothetical protein